MKLRRTLAIVGITVMIAGGLTAVAGGAASAASSAAAAGDSQLCIDPANESPFCALDPTDVGATSQYGVFMSEALGSDWVYPTKPFNNTYSNNSSNTNYIVEAATDSCLQIDEADSWVVRLAPCIGDQAESWENWYNATTRRTEFVSTYFSGDDFFYLCLSFDASGTDVPGSTSGDILRADPCTPGGGPLGTDHWYQQWGRS